MIDVKRQEEAFETTCSRKKIVKLGNVANFSKGKNVSKSDIVETGRYQAIRYGELYTKYKENITDVISTVDSEKDTVKSKSGDILIPSSGETAIDIATASCILLDNVIIGGDINIIDVDKKQINPVFLSYYINSSLKTEIAKLAQGISVIHIYNKELSSLQLKIPELHLQNKCSNFLTSLDELIQKQEEYIELLKIQKKGYSQKIFNQQLRFKDFKTKWNTKYIDDVVTIQNNKRIPVTSQHRVKGKTPYYGANGIQDYVDGFTHKGEYILLAEDGANDLSNYPCYIVQGEIWVNNHAHVMQCKSEYYNQYVVQYIRNIDFSPFLVGGSRAKLNLNILKKIQIILPSLEEQEKIGEILIGFEEKIELHKHKLELLKIKKKYYLNNIFTL